MFDQPVYQRIKARSGPGGILLMQPEFIEKLLSNALNITILFYSPTLIYKTDHLGWGLHGYKNLILELKLKGKVNHE
jgi:hypothetical protein